MKGIISTAIVTATIVTLSSPASAFFRNDAGDRYEQERIRDAEFKRSSRLGGYSDPISAFMDLLNGEVKDKDLQPGISDIYEAEAEIYRIPEVEKKK